MKDASNLLKDVTVPIKYGPQETPSSISGSCALNLTSKIKKNKLVKKVNLTINWHSNNKGHSSNPNRFN